MIDWLPEYTDPQKSVFASPQREAVCLINFCLAANNRPEWQVCWHVDSYLTGGLDEPSGSQVFYTPASNQAWILSSFEFPVQPNKIYIVQRDGEDVDDTALGTEHIVSTSFCFGVEDQ